MKGIQAFQEINRAAAERASQALAKLIGARVTVEIAKAEMQPIVACGKTLDPEEIVTAICVPIAGDLCGTSLLVFPKQMSLMLCDVLMRRPPGTTRSLSKIDESALKEVGNIIAGNFLTVLADLLEIRLVEHLPTLSADMYGAVLDQAAAALAERSDKVLVLEVQFRFDAMTVEGRLVLLLAVEAIDAMVRSLKIV